MTSNGKEYKRKFFKFEIQNHTPQDVYQLTFKYLKLIYKNYNLVNYKYKKVDNQYLVWCILKIKE